jgi:carboxyl-terminal processing protease
MTVNNGVSMTVNMKKILLNFVAILALGISSALASPAQDLFNQATYYIAFYYYGYANADYQNFSSKYQAELDTACKDQLEKCPYEAAVPVIRKMIDELEDGHTYFLSKQDRDEAARSRTGQGADTPRLGVTLVEIKTSGELLITDVIEDSPAAKANLRRGDRIVSVGGQGPRAYPDGLRVAIRQSIASDGSVRLGLQRGSRTFDLTLKAARVSPPLPSLRVLSGGIGVLRLPTFEVLNRVALTVHQLVRRAQQQNLRALIDDVRDNPGGEDVEFVASAGAFLNELYYVVETRQSTTSRLWRNGVVYVADSTGVPITPLYNLVALSGQASWKGRMAVLVNANSYSGAEYFAQAIQDAKRGVVIGEATGGLGNTVTTQYDLQDGSAVALTLGRSLRRDGTPLPERVMPDVVVKDDLDVLAATGRDIVLERAVELVSAR